MKTTVVNVKQLQRKSSSISVVKISKNLYRASSTTSRFWHLVILKRFSDGSVRFECNCEWGRLRGDGCVHAMAVVRHVMERKGKTVSFWNSEEDAKNQKRKVYRIGDNLWITVKRKKMIEVYDHA